MLDPGPASWWAALESNGLDNLSAPELAHAVQELAYDRPAFLGVLAAASDYPRFSLCSQRRPDRDKMAALDRHLPRCRAVLVPEDESAIRAALAAFDVLLVLDPLWHAPDLLYASWHARGDIPPAHAQRLQQLLAPAVRLSSAREALRFIPDHLPGSWDPFPTPAADPNVAALRRAAGLLYWASCLRAVAVAGPPIGQALRELARAGPDLRGGGGAEVHVGLSETRPNPRPDWGARFDHLTDDPRPLLDCLPVADDGPRWCLGLSAPALPDVSLALRRVQMGRPIASGRPGTACRLPRRSVYLVLA